MEPNILAATIAGVSAIAGAAVGGVFPWLSQRDHKARERAAKRIERLENEVRARIALEKAAIEWIVELRGKDEQGAGVQRELRQRAVGCAFVVCLHATIVGGVFSMFEQWQACQFHGAIVMLFQDPMTSNLGDRVVVLV